MKNLFFLVLLSLFTSCIAINVNGYQFLNYAEKEYLRPYEASKNHEKSDNEDCFKLFEITTPDIKSIIKQEEITWLHIWLPYCANESCTSITQYESFEKRHKPNGLNLTFISSTYDMNEIIKITQHSKFNKPVFVLKSSYYGFKNKKIRKKLHSELDPNFKEEDRVFYSDYLFINDSLVYMGDEINDSIVERFTSK